MLVSPTVLQRAHEIAFAVVERMPAGDLETWAGWCEEHGADVTVWPEDDGELCEIRCGGQPLAILPLRILTDPNVTTFSVLGALPAVPDDISGLECP